MITFGNNSYIYNTYSATGEKLMTQYDFHMLPIQAPLSGNGGTTETEGVSGPGGTRSGSATPVDTGHRYYCGNVVYDRGVTRLLTDEGYVTFSETGAPVYHYYLRDHLGNIRVVMGQTGAVEQVSHYYAFGGLMRESTNPGLQPYKYGGKEIDRFTGLDAYDFGARSYFADRMQWSTMDPLSEKYYDVSPYAYCGNNPVRYIDPDGKKVYVFATILPSPYSAVRNSGATHTFTVVKTSDGKTYRYTYGPTNDKKIFSFSGTANIVERNYNQDINAVTNYFKTGHEDENTKNVIPVNVPEGMTEEAFDNAVINSAKQFHGNKTVKYRLIPLGETEGNCNTSTTSLLKNAGVNDDEIDRIESEISGIDIGFGSVKPWTEEQRNAAEACQEERRKMNESLSNHIGF